MRFGIVTVAILLAVASRGYGRPRDPDPLDSSQEVTATTNGSSDSRYMMTMTRQTASSTITSNRRHDISINSFKNGNSSSSKSGRAGRPMYSGLSFESERKNYLPLGALSSTNPRSDIGIKLVNHNRQSIARRIDNYNPLTIPFISSHVAMPITIPVSITPRNKTSLLRSTPKSIPLFVTQKPGNDIINMTFRGERKMGSRTLVRIVPQSFKPVYNVRKNSTILKLTQQVANEHLKNWPNEAIQNVQDLFNYQKYTSFVDDKKNNRNKRPINVTKAPNREPLIKSPEIQPVRWSKIPVVEVITPLPNDRVDIDTTMQIDNLLDDLASNKLHPQFQTSSEVAQNTVVHILNAGSRKPNVTVNAKPANVHKINRTKTGSTRPPQNVHIMFMTNKDESVNNTEQPKPPTEILGTDTDCPTIMINSITQINNTIESKEGCTDLNIVINSQVLNNHIFKPSPNVPNYPLNSTETSKNPYASSPENSVYPSNNGNNNYNQNNNNNIHQYPNNQVQSDESGMGQSANPEPGTSTLEIFQGTHINIGGGSGSTDLTVETENINTGSSGTDGLGGTDADGSPLQGSEEESNDVAGINPSDGTGSEGTAETDSTASNPTEGGQSSVPASLGDGGSGQANDAPGSISLPSLPNIPNLPNVANPLSNLAGNAGSGGSGGIGGGGQSGLDEDDDDDDDLTEALSPVGLLDSITSVFDYVSDLNPINYGIFGMAVAPFVAFAAGIVGVAAFIFPWAFPGSLELGRKWDEKHYAIKQKYYPSIRDVVHSSIHKYRHLNEWKGRRRKKKRKR